MKSSDHLQDLELHAYLDEELDKGARAAVEAHLADCQDCRQELAELRALFAEVESAGEVELARDLAPSVVVELRRRQQPSPGLGWITVLEVLIAGALLALVGLTGAEGALLSLPSWPGPDPFAFLPRLQATFFQGGQTLTRTFGSWQWEQMARFATDPGVLLAGQIPWLPVLAALALLWLLGNGLLLGGGGDRLGRVSDGRTSQNGATHG